MRRLAALTLAVALAACSAEKEAEPSPTPTATIAEPRTLVAADFDPATLGVRLAGVEIADGIIGDAKEPLGRFTAYVACAQEVAVCDPAVLPSDTRYTYVLTITPVAADAPATPAATPPPVPLDMPVPPTLTMRLPAPGFDGAVGYSLAEAEAALGAEDALSISLDRGRVIWRANTNAWQGGKPITVWWQTTRPPAKASTAYEFAFRSDSAEVTAPFPAADKPVDPAPAR